MKWTELCEKERQNSLYTMFVTLTYDELHLPKYNLSGGFDEPISDEMINDCFQSAMELKPTGSHDVECIPFLDLEFEDVADADLFKFYLKNGGIPYASRSDVQLFHKRLNKFFYDNVTNKYQNFRYFIVSEYGSTTLRPHFHALYFVNDSDVARRFSEGVLSCWKYGRVDVQYVEKSACSYVAQYINKPTHLPSFFNAKPLRPFFCFSRCPVIGSFDKYSQSDEEIFNGGLIQTIGYERKDSRLVLVQLDKACENRLFPKCPNYRKISHYVRVELYSAVLRFPSRTFEGFYEKVKKYLNEVYEPSDYLLSLVPDSCRLRVTEFSDILKEFTSKFNMSGIDWLKRLFYLSRKIVRQAQYFHTSVVQYVHKIEEYWNKKELYLLNNFYQFQSDYVQQKNNCSDDLALMYPEWLHQNGISIGEFLENYTPDDVRVVRMDAAFYATTNKLTHFKNAYLDSLKHKDNLFFKQLKVFYHAKKCYEISQTFAA